ncbi:putative membrane protein [Natronoarchaeum philippinense]|uniref:Putative membrane protein n=1 Tax=Natronoarchaeum philippinense TaxID=558529 RepID=A0A285N5T6_NATPI|nr:PH domain-containing protein [Natronoarchaeum philippinense]SNZ04770.1 putative membrane protein [Natronoarchaeum philippinense]
MTTLHPLSIPYRAAQRVWQFVGFFVVFAFSGTLLSGDGLQAAGLLGLVGAILVAVVVWEVLYYRRFEYDLTETTFDLHSGVLSRRDREIPYRRVQNVSISRNVVERVLGLAEVTVETAGGSSAEAELRYVGVEEANRLQDELGRRKRRAAREDGRSSASREDAEGRSVERPKRTRLFAISDRELVVLGLVSVDLRLLPLATLLLPVFGSAAAQELAAGPLFVVAPLSAIGLYAVTALASGAISVANYYGFELVQTGDELRYERGLLQRYSGTIPLGKVQTVSMTENVLQRLVGYASLSIETAGSSPGQAGGSQSAVPIAKRDRVLQLAQSVEPFGDPSFERPPKRARLRYVARYSIVLAVLVGVAFLADRATATTLYWYALLLAVPAIPVAAHLKWRNLGYALEEDHVVTRAGFWNRTTTVVPYYRVQTVLDSQTIFQRRRQLATVTIDTAGSRSLTGQDARAVDIDRTRAAELREDVAERLQRSLADRTPAPDRLFDAEQSSDGTVGGTPSPGE